MVVWGLWLSVGLSLRIPAAGAAVPHLIRYQGQVADSQGVPLEGPYKLTFRLYDAATAGTKVWEELQPNIPLTAGHFSVLLGQVTVLTVDWSKSLWLSVQVGTEPELSPRQPITSVPLALVAEQLEGLRVVGGNIGLGTTSPGSMAGYGPPVIHLKAGDTSIRLESAGGSYELGVSGGHLSFLRNSTDALMRLTSAGAVGIGTTNPGAKLEVAGQIKMTGGSPGAGKVLTSDATGVATWGTPSTVPSGVIVMWSGSVASIPAGWALCNGASGTPDLRDRFIIGVGSTYSPGQVGGAAAINLQHNHGGRTGGVIFNAPNGVLTAGALDMRHNHSISNDLSAAQSILPPYYALAYIMKL